MSAAALLAELNAAGITLVPEGPSLRVLAPAGLDLSAFVPRIREMKDELLLVTANAPAAEWVETEQPTPDADDERVLSQAEALAAGLNPRLRWMRVPGCGESVEPTEPPAGWDGALPATCRHDKYCRILGPCPHPLTRCASTPEGDVQ